VPRLFPRSQPMVFRRARVLSEGDDVLIVSSGICTEEAMRAVEVLGQRGLSLAHVHVSTLKPFDDPIVEATLRRKFRGVVTLENHSIVGGVGSVVAETMAEFGVGTPLVRLGLRDEYAHGASRPYLMRKYAMDARGLVGAIERLLGRRFSVEPDELAAVPLDAESVSSAEIGSGAFAKAEDL
jgi:transketolase